MFILLFIEMAAHSTEKISTFKSYIQDGWCQQTKSFWIIGITQKFNYVKDTTYPMCLISAIPKDTFFPVDLTADWLKQFHWCNWSPLYDKEEPFPKMVNMLTGGEDTSGGCPPARAIRGIEDRGQPRPRFTPKTGLLYGVQLPSQEDYNVNFLYQLC